MKKLRLINYITCAVCMVGTLLLIGGAYMAPVYDIPANTLATLAALFFGVPGLLLGLSGKFLNGKPLYVLFFSAPLVLWGGILLWDMNEVLYILLFALLFLLVGATNIYFALRSKTPLTR